MSQSMVVILGASLVGALAVLLWGFVKEKGLVSLVVGLVLLGLTVLLLHVRFGFPSSAETKGIGDQPIAVILCYVAMLVGMVAHHFYTALAAGGRKARNDLAGLLMPLLVSPIVFVPLLTLLGQSSVGGALDSGPLVTYIVAFQNGFFWREVLAMRKPAA